MAVPKKLGEEGRLEFPAAEHDDVLRLGGPLPGTKPAEAPFTYGDMSSFPRTAQVRNQPPAAVRAPGDVAKNSPRPRPLPDPLMVQPIEVVAKKPLPVRVVKKG